MFQAHITLYTYICIYVYICVTCVPYFSPHILLCNEPKEVGDGALWPREELSRQNEHGTKGRKVQGGSVTGVFKDQQRGQWPCSRPSIGRGAGDAVRSGRTRVVTNSLDVHRALPHIAGYEAASCSYVQSQSTGSNSP